MVPKEGYDVLRLVEHGQTCYISSEYVDGRILANWLRYHPHVSKERLLGWVQMIAKQLGMIHKCRKKPFYQYVNPYSVVITEEGDLYFLDFEAQSNEEMLRFMRRRVVREYFLPAEEPYYQKASISLDIYGFGRTIQYLLAVSEPDPPLTKKEEKKFQKIISRCLKRQSKKSYQNVSEIRKHIPIMKEKTKRTYSRRTKFFFAAGVIIIIASVCMIAFSKEKDQGKKAAITTVEEPKEENVSEKKEIQNAYLDLVFEYFLELNDCKKSLEYLEKIKKEDEQAKDLEVIIKAVENEKSEINRTALKNHLKSLEESMIQEKADQYCQCLIRGYGMLTGEQAAESILRLGNQYLEQEHIGKEGEKEVKEYMASSCETLDKVKEAAELYEGVMELETDVYKREELYKKIAMLYESCEEKDMALDTCVQGIEELEDSVELRLLHIRLICKDSSVDRSFCAQTVQEYMRKVPEILENEEFQKLQQEYEIRIEGEEVWVGNSNG